MNNLVIVAHPDDEILGFGGAGAACVNMGQTVQSVILCGGVDARSQRPSDEQLHADLQLANQVVGFQQPVLGSFPNIQMNTVPHLELVQFIETQIELFQPDRIFTHHPSDLNDDHRHIAHACMAAARLSQRRDALKPLKGLFFMEILSSTDWAFPTNTGVFSPNFYVDISTTLNQKIEALSCYRNVIRQVPHPRSEEVLRGHARYRGGQCGSLAAEAFQLVYGFGL